jgi:hypothetical protein
MNSQLCRTCAPTQQVWVTGRVYALVVQEELRRSRLGPQRGSRSTAGKPQASDLLGRSGISNGCCSKVARCSGFKVMAGAIRIRSSPVELHTTSRFLATNRTDWRAEDENWRSQDDLGFRRMHFQVALRQPGWKLHLEGLRLVLRPTVHQPIVCISTPQEITPP